jgi:hypothetical protein
MHHRTVTLPALTVLAAALLAVPARADETVDFTRDVRPILAQFCFKCHGPDEKARKAKLRLDVRAEAVKAVIVPGKPDESELVARVFAEQADERMPPAATKMTLTRQQKETLKRWIAAGAEYRQYWAFVPPRQAPLPAVQRANWPLNPIDRFVLARLESEGLQPSPPADRYTLIRRVSLDLIGLPPTPEEVEAFVLDSRPDAYERLVDRLLASPHYGERWARRWLDLARYADTNGYEKDRPRSMWPYRDWVINALNTDLPFDRFTVEQLAGDHLPNATPEQRIATGFHRNTMLNEEGGIDPLEFRFHAMTDRVAVTGTTWLGLTIGCAQCHTHKFDPISQREYYRLMAFLDNADEPELDLPRPEITARRKELEARIEALTAGLADRFPPEVRLRAGGPWPVLALPVRDDRPLEVRRREHLEKKFDAWATRTAARVGRWRVLRPSEAKANLPHLTILPDDSVLASGDQTKSDTYELTFRGDFRGVTAVRLEALPDDSLPKHGPGRVYYEGPFGDFHLSEITASADGRPAKFAGATHSFANGNFTAAAAIDGNPQTGWGVGGGQGRRQVAVFRLAEPLKGARELRVKLLFERYYAAGLGRFRIGVTTGAKPGEALDLPAEVEAALRVAPAGWSPEQRQRVLRQFLLTAPELAAARAEIDGLRKQLPAYPTALVLQERPPENPRPTFLHHRGEFLQPTERVGPGVPEVLPPLGLTNQGAHAPRSPDRLTFARWLVAPENPLTARVTVNRQWAAFFGRGIVRTVEDFGYQGDPPTHPELLDWLAVEFVRRGWSLKQLHRLLVTSATYRQSSRVTPELLAKDPENRLLARGPRVRLEAELIRDATLRAGGVLSEKVGGPSVFPPQPANVTTEGAYGALNWVPSRGEDRYRRSLYTFSKRTAPFALFAAFDGPSGEACVARRDVTNTPLQALALLNDVAITEAAQALGRELAAKGGPDEGRVRLAFLRCLARPPAADEAGLLADFVRAQRRHFAEKESDARKLAGDGPGAVTERAAWTALARALFNLDEFVTKN